MGEIDALVNAFFIHVPYDFRFARVGAGPVADVFQSEFGRKGPVPTFSCADGVDYGKDAAVVQVCRVSRIRFSVCIIGAQIEDTRFSGVYSLFD